MELGGEMATSIFLADDQRLIREGLRRILEKREDFRVVGEAEDGADAVRMISEQAPDVALLELLLPRLSGMTAIERIRAESPHTRCIALSSRQSRGFVQEALRAGAAGYVVKSASSQELIEAIDVVALGALSTSRRRSPRTSWRR